MTDYTRILEILVYLVLLKEKKGTPWFYYGINFLMLLLKDNGQIFLGCDPHAHRVKLVSLSPLSLKEEFSLKEENGTSVPDLLL